MTVETGEILINTKDSIRKKDPNNRSDTETGTLSNLDGRFYSALMSQSKTQNTFLICKSSSFTRKVVRAESENPAMISRFGFCSTNRICASEDPIYRGAFYV